MSKMNNTLCWVYKSLRVIAIVTAAIIAIACVYVNFNTRITENTVTLESIQELANDGCKPARQATTDIAVIKVVLENIELDVKELTVEQKAMREEHGKTLREILRKLP